jgi:hypothetical protein
MVSRQRRQGHSKFAQVAVTFGKADLQITGHVDELEYTIDSIFFFFFFFCVYL